MKPSKEAIGDARVPSGAQPTGILLFTVVWMVACGVAPLGASERRGAIPSGAAAAPGSEGSGPEVQAPSTVSEFWNAEDFGLLAAMDRSSTVAVWLHERVAVIEQPGSRWLCWWQEVPARCFSIDSDLPSVVGIRGADESAYSAVLRVSEGRLGHDVAATFVDPAVVVRHVRSQTVDGLNGTDEYAKPPSRRLGGSGDSHAELWTHRTLTLVADPASAAQPVLEALQKWRLHNESIWYTTFSYIREADSRLAVIGQGGNGSRRRSLICTQADTEMQRCFDMEGRHVAPLRTARQPGDGWLLMAGWSATRSRSSALVHVAPEGWRAERIVGAVHGRMGACGFATGYCGWIDGRWVPIDAIQPDCVEMWPAVQWNSVYVIRDRVWINEVVVPPGRDESTMSTTYRATPEGWIPWDCGPRSEEP